MLRRQASSPRRWLGQIGQTSGYAAKRETETNQRVAGGAGGAQGVEELAAEPCRLFSEAHLDVGAEPSFGRVRRETRPAAGCQAHGIARPYQWCVRFRLPAPRRCGRSTPNLPAATPYGPRRRLERVRAAQPVAPRLMRSWLSRWRLKVACRPAVDSLGAWTSAEICGPADDVVGFTHCSKHVEEECEEAAREKNCSRQG